MFRSLGNPAADVSFAGYRVPDFYNNFFLALKIAPREVKTSQVSAISKNVETHVLERDAFATLAAQRVKDLRNAGEAPQMTLVKIDNLEKVKGDLSADNREELLSMIGQFVSGKSIGGDTAGQIDEESFSIIHAKDTDVSDVGRQIEEAARRIDPAAAILQSTTTTIDAIADDLSEEQMAKAIIHTMKNFSAGKKVSPETSLSGTFKGMMAHTLRQAESFRKVCATKSFDLVFMPICDLQTRHLHHFEALTRFRGGTGNESPFELITLAEEIGVISDFDLAVADKAIGIIAKESKHGNLKPIAINVSGLSIQNSDFIEDLLKLLRKTPYLGEKLHLEITESSEIHDLDNVNGVIQEFRREGFKIALDDFGAGAASFDYLNSLDVDTVKFDGPVVKRAYATDKGRAFLSSMATLCKESGIETIAEMVEDEPMVDFLGKCWIHLGQGYCFGKPDRDLKSFDHLLK